MLEITYVYTIILGCLFVYKTLRNDPEYDQIWGSGSGKASTELDQKELEIKNLKIHLDHYKNIAPDVTKESSKEESIA